uniref:Uncharacterized protein n=1 Tax=Arundo donax TaxID=35708 RepID=A0A0A9B7H2_ARUDO
MLWLSIPIFQLRPILVMF